MKNICIVIAVTISSISFAQDYKSEFGKYFREKDTIKQKETLEAWGKAKPTDAELFTSYFNYYFQKSKKEILSLTRNEPEGEALILKDSLNQTAGYLGSTINYGDTDLKNAFTKIDKGISLYPDRLDMRFGKIYALGKIQDWEKFTSEIIKAVDYSAKNNNNWTWTNNEKKEDGKQFFLASLQSYQVQLYDTENDNLLTNMREIASAILKYYPDSIESLSNVSVTYFLTGKYNEGLEALFKAEKLNPKDYIVLSNIAQGYKLSGNKAKAIEYYEKTIQYGDEETKTFAINQISELKK
ncbi:tetratricopeptide repeat protein [Flavobacterium sp. AS60]|uniref:tetratricopeptide repeat protein n=1 Tax=Flavobacterium anseongense TaxID=2910677 RepID=UPI001F163C13|nr:tetratricopeptide repeat protein [Flavobacterium sp. AS60]MCF6129348.1 tetratricopeptide repeat protein [Flavobacterium sp. AS60]